MGYIVKPFHYEVHEKQSISDISLKISANTISKKNQNNIEFTIMLEHFLSQYLLGISNFKLALHFRFF